MSDAAPQEPNPRFRYSETGLPFYLPEHWGYDHASLLLYVEDMHLDHHGQLNVDYVRTNRDSRPMEWAQRRDQDHQWRPGYGTRIAGGERPCTDHDDWDCLEDFRLAGLLDYNGAPEFQAALSDIGIEVAGELRKFRGRGNPVAEFDWEKAMAEARKKVEG